MQYNSFSIIIMIMILYSAYKQSFIKILEFLGHYKKLLNHLFKYYKKFCLSHLTYKLQSKDWRSKKWFLIPKFYFNKI